MCGIVGYVGHSQACAILLDGLKRLEYRGYDSAGIAVSNNRNVVVSRTKGKIQVLEDEMKHFLPEGRLGVGHTRWATHGKPSETNAHPHRAGRVVVVHNGIIENYVLLKNALIASGRTFRSETDSEVIAQLLDHHLEQGMRPLEAIKKLCGQLKGSFATAILIADDKKTLYGIRKESPLIVGIGEKECFLASDAPAILNHTRQIIFMDDGEIATLRAGEYSFADFNGNPVKKIPRTVDLNPVMAEKGGYKHFMLKEIFEQPRSVYDTFRGRICQETREVVLDGLKISDEEIKRLSRIIIIACGTSYYAGLVGRRIIEGLTRIPVEVDLASEFRYRDPIIGANTLLISISQSGETADTLAATKEGASRGAQVVSICNVLESSLARISAQGVIYTHAGPEIGVASTKAFTSQITVLYLLGIYLAWKRRTIGLDHRKNLIGDLICLPQMMDKALGTSGQLSSLARIYEKYSNFLYLGRGINTAIAYEGALKLKEISYIHAEAYPGGEMKHGPIALISEQMPVVAILTRDNVYEKMLANMEEVRSREGILLAVCAGEVDDVCREMAREVVEVPMSNRYLSTILLTLPLQLLAYHIADFKGTDVDQPRNLAKSVTVE
jgi:glucosamine--fructose-6-phosphate aminotransferase (isomerizing)